MPPAYNRQPLNLTSNASQSLVAEQAASQSRVKSSRFVVFLSHCRGWLGSCDVRNDHVEDLRHCVELCIWLLLLFLFYLVVSFDFLISLVVLAPHLLIEEPMLDPNRILKGVETRN